MSTATLKAESPGSQVLKDKADIRRVVQILHEAHHNKDAAAIVAEYAQDAVVFDLAPPLAHHGLDREEKQAWLDSWEGPVDQESRDLNITVAGDFAFCHGFLRLGGMKKGASHAVSFWMRATARRLADRPRAYLRALLHGRQLAAGL
jgi:ketosteroid isomerase-like protein